MSDDVNAGRLADKYGSGLAILLDHELPHLLDGVLMPKADYHSSRVRPSSYELTLGRAESLNRETLPTLDMTDSSRLSVAAFITFSQEKHWLNINPMQCCMLFTSEELELPDNVVAHVLARGQLFEKGLIVESTYVDPGFGKNQTQQDPLPSVIHLMAFNATNRVAVLPIGMPIARLELYRIERAVERPHGGREKIVRPEVLEADFGWPDRLPDFSAEVRSAREARERARLVTMDRSTHAIEMLSTETLKIKRQLWQNRLIMSGLVMCAIWIFMERFSKQIVDINPELKPYVDSPIVAMIVFLLGPLVMLIVAKDAREALRQVVRSQ